MSKLAQAGASTTTLPGRGRRERGPHRARPCRAASRTATAAPSASRISGRASPIATTAPCRARSGSSSSPRSPPLKRPPMNHHQPVVEALDRAPRRLDVGRLRIVDEPDAADLADRLERVLQAGEAFDRAGHRLGVDPGERTRPPPPPSRRRPGARPSSWIAASGTSGWSTGRRRGGRSRRPRSPRRRRCASVSENSRPAGARAIAGQRQRRRVVGVQHRPVVRPLVARRSAPWRRRIPRRRHGGRDDPARS